MDLTQLKWIKNVKHKGDDRYWAYEPKYMSIPEAKIFCLNWRSHKDKDNAQKPCKGDLMLLLQKAKVTHIVEFLDNDIYGGDRDEWGIYRIVKALWIPPEKFAWENLPHQREFFGFNYVVGDGHAHSLADSNKMRQFHEHWDLQGGLQAFQNHVHDILRKIS